eukprot:TRINITY_DN61502_c0_g1_i1.p1 TRINITY_DN61502_c0_g1~~TRINITY_DN61502_c0_g1_i1.p1  ORF type:complete len:398 (+),score=111.65 TRINITY_DN61502_c0_g1_i1:75-1196(+)
MVFRATRAGLRAARAGRSARKSPDLSEVPQEAHAAFRLLRVGPRTPAREIKSSYRELARLHHPDVNAGDDSKMKEVNRAYATVLRHLVAAGGAAGAPDADPSTTDAGAAPGGDREPNKEHDLLRRLGDWLRQGPSASDDPTAAYRAHTRASETAQHILGTDEEELAWAQRWLEERERRLHLKNQWRRRDGDYNPFDTHSTAQLGGRLEQLSVRDTLYWRMPLVPPTPPLALRAPGGGDQQMWVRRKREQQLRHFVARGGTAEHHAMLEDKDAERERLLRLRRFKEWTRRPASRKDDTRSLTISMRDMHEKSWTALQPRTGPSDLITNELQTRPPRYLRRGRLMSFTTQDKLGTPRKVVMSEDAFAISGSAYLG